MPWYSLHNNIIGVLNIYLFVLAKVAFLFCQQVLDLLGVYVYICMQIMLRILSRMYKAKVKVLS